MKNGPNNGMHDPYIQNYLQFCWNERIYKKSSFYTCAETGAWFTLLQTCIVASKLRLQ